MRLGLLILLAALPSCVYNQATDEWRFDPAVVTIDTADEPEIGDSIDHHLRVQRYMREHNGKVPSPDVKLRP
jgi:hypothetical protein